MMKNKIIKYSIEIIRIFLYLLIVLISIILLYSKFSTRESDIYLNDFLGNFHKVDEKYYIKKDSY